MMLTRPIRFTRFGIFYILFALAVGAAAINTGNNLLYLILGILLGFIVVSGILSDSGLWGLTSEWTAAETCYAGEPVRMDCLLRKHRYPGVLVDISTRWENADPVHHWVPWISGRSAESFRIIVHPQRRGWLRLREVRYASRYPFGLFEKFHTITFDKEWLVYPRIQRRDVDRLGGEDHRNSHRLAERQGAGSVPFILRDFKPGDSARRIHWKISARRHTWVVNEMEEERDPGELIWVSHWPQGISADQQEEFISFVASIAFELHQRGRPVGLKAPMASFTPENSREQLDRILRALALLDLKAAAGRSVAPPTGRCIDAYGVWSRKEKSIYAAA